MASDQDNIRVIKGQFSDSADDLVKRLFDYAVAGDAASLKEGLQKVTPDMSLTDNRGFTLAHIAALNGHKDILTALNEASQPVNPSDKDGLSLLNFLSLASQPDSFWDIYPTMPFAIPHALSAEEQNRSNMFYDVRQHIKELLGPDHPDNFPFKNIFSLLKPSGPR